MFGIAACNAIGKPCGQIIHGANECGSACSANCAVVQAVQRDCPVRNFDLQVPTTNGVRWCNVPVLIAHRDKAVSPYSIHIVREIDTRKRLELLVRDFLMTGAGLSSERTNALLSSTRSPARETNLSGRELEILKAMAKGVRTQGIAEQLHIRPTTVNNHVQHILSKLGSHTRLDAVRRAEHAGLI